MDGNRWYMASVQISSRERSPTLENVVLLPLGTLFSYPWERCSPTFENVVLLHLRTLFSYPWERCSPTLVAIQENRFIRIIL